MKAKTVRQPVVATVRGEEHPKIIGRRKVGKETIKVGEVPDKIKGGFVGINKPAAKQLHIKATIPYHEVVVFKGEKGTPSFIKRKIKHTTTQHELIEQHLERYAHLPYKKAHKIALKFEETKATPQQVLKWYRAQQKKRPHTHRKAKPK